MQTPELAQLLLGSANPDDITPFSPGQQLARKITRRKDPGFLAQLLLDPIFLASIGTAGALRFGPGMINKVLARGLGTDVVGRSAAEAGLGRMIRATGEETAESLARQAERPVEKAARGYPAGQYATGVPEMIVPVPKPIEQPPLSDFLAARRAEAQPQGYTSTQPFRGQTTELGAAPEPELQPELAQVLDPAQQAHMQQLLGMDLGEVGPPLPPGIRAAGQVTEVPATKAGLEKTGHPFGMGSVLREQLPGEQPIPGITNPAAAPSKVALGLANWLQNKGLIDFHPAVLSDELRQQTMQRGGPAQVISTVPKKAVLHAQTPEGKQILKEAQAEVQQKLDLQGHTTQNILQGHTAQEVNQTGFRPVTASDRQEPLPFLTETSAAYPTTRPISSDYVDIPGKPPITHQLLDEVVSILEDKNLSARQVEERINATINKGGVANRDDIINLVRQVQHSVKGPVAAGARKRVLAAKEQLKAAVVVPNNQAAITVAQAELNLATIQEEMARWRRSRTFVEQLKKGGYPVPPADLARFSDTQLQKRLADIEVAKQQVALARRGVQPHENLVSPEALAKQSTLASKIKGEQVAAAEARPAQKPLSKKQKAATLTGKRPIQNGREAEQLTKKQLLRYVDISLTKDFQAMRALEGVANADEIRAVLNEPDILPGQAVAAPETGETLLEQLGGAQREPLPIEQVAKTMEEEIRKGTEIAPPAISAEELDQLPRAERIARTPKEELPYTTQLLGGQRLQPLHRILQSKVEPVAARLAAEDVGAEELSRAQRLTRALQPKREAKAYRSKYRGPSVHERFANEETTQQQRVQLKRLIRNFSWLSSATPEQQELVINHIREKHTPGLAAQVRKIANGEVTMPTVAERTQDWTPTYLTTKKDWQDRQKQLLKIGEETPRRTNPLDFTYELPRRVNKLPKASAAAMMARNRTAFAEALRARRDELIRELKAAQTIEPKQRGILLDQALQARGYKAIESRGKIYTIGTQDVRGPNIGLDEKLLEKPALGALLAGVGGGGTHTYVKRKRQE